MKRAIVKKATNENILFLTFIKNEAEFLYVLMPLISFFKKITDGQLQVTTKQKSTYSKYDLLLKTCNETPCNIVKTTQFNCRIYLSNNFC